MYLKFLVKGLCFFTDRLKHETGNKKTCRNPSVNPRQLCTRYLNSFQLMRLFFEAFRIPCFIWQSIFDHFSILLI